jgi:hypothetical protein
MADTDKELLREVANQLDRWARESESGGWSTHQVNPQRQLADKIYAHLGRSQPSASNQSTCWFRN